MIDYIFYRVYWAYNKKIWLINKKFEGNGYNYKIPDWCFFVVLPLSIVWGIITYSLLVKFFIKPFALRGIIHNML